MDTLSPDTVETIRLVVALFIPIMVGVVTKYGTSAALKATVLTVLSAVNTAVTEFLSAGDADFNAIFRRFVFTTVVAIATYFGIWRPTGVAEAVREKTAGFGLGHSTVLDDIAVMPKLEIPLAPYPTDHVPTTRVRESDMESTPSRQPKRPKNSKAEQDAHPETDQEQGQLKKLMGEELKKQRRGQ